MVKTFNTKKSKIDWDRIITLSSAIQYLSRQLDQELIKIPKNKNTK